MMYKRLIVLFGMFLGSHAPVVAQTPAQMVLAQERVVPTITTPRTVSTSLLTASLLHQDPKKSPAHFSHLFAGVYERDDSMEHLPPTEAVKTLFFTHSSLPLVELWSGRLRLEAFQNTLQIQNVQLGPLGIGGVLNFRPPRESYPGGPRSVHFSGLSLSFYFGRDARMGRPIQAWRCLPRFVGTVLN